MESPEPQLSAGPRKGALGFIFITILLDMLALGVIIPVLPALVKEFEGGDTARAAEMMGAFGATFAAMQFLFSPVIGALSDRFGRRPIVLLSNFGLGLDYILMALAPSIHLLFVGRIIAGICAASIGAASAYIADVTTEEKRAQGFGMLSAAWGLGFVFGPALGGVLGENDPRLPFWVAAGLSIMNGIYGIIVLPESLPREKRRTFDWNRANPIGSLMFLRTHGNLLGFASIVFLLRLAHAALPSVFVLYVGYRYGWGERAAGLAVALYGICAIVIGGVLVGRVVALVGERASVLIGITCAAAGTLLAGLAPIGKVFLLAIPVQAFWGLEGPAMQSLMTRQLDPGDQGKLQGAIASLTAVTEMLGPPTFTWIFAAFIKEGAPIHLPGAPFIAAAGLLAAALGMAFIFAKAPAERAAPAPAPNAESIP